MEVTEECIHELTIEDVHWITSACVRVEAKCDTCQESFGGILFPIDSEGGNS